jgi:phage shock protein C
VEKRLTRNPNDTVIAGVASGLADYLGLNVTLVRILFLLLFLPGGLSPLLYVLLWIVMPERPATYVSSSVVEPYRYDPATGEPIQH